MITADDLDITRIMMSYGFIGLYTEDRERKPRRRGCAGINPGRWYADPEKGVPPSEELEMLQQKYGGSLKRNREGKVIGWHLSHRAGILSLCNTLLTDPNFVGSKRKATQAIVDYYANVLSFKELARINRRPSLGRLINFILNHPDIDVAAILARLQQETETNAEHCNNPRGGGF